MVFQHTGGDHGLGPELTIGIAKIRNKVRSRLGIPNLYKRSNNVHPDVLIRAERFGQLRECASPAKDAERPDSRDSNIAIVISASSVPQSSGDSRIDRYIWLDN